MTSVGRLSEEPEESGAMAVENTGPPLGARAPRRGPSGLPFLGAGLRSPLPARWALSFERPEDLLDSPELLILVVALRGFLEPRRNRS
ncbi:hypothetical protein HPB52_012687 [Rhipicephalus sanguineus]|uniref:Uncharacterized protein n=1 Tax=Rhipicephalus sanguineus TaxID=34632 RepID=A0A9D4T7S7_RHISA|nr:hypothetical protein HPB52_012687 [Rhipicephalus sanguineus]